MAIPGPGWYTDPESAAHLRWWSGDAWTEHKQAKPQSQPQVSVVGEHAVGQSMAGAVQPMAEATPYVPMASRYDTAVIMQSTKLTRVEKDRQVRKNNSFAYTGCVLALVAFIVNPFAVLSILGIIFSSIGLAKSHDLDGRQKVTGRGTAIAGILVGLLGLAAFAWALHGRLA